jgi:putative ABC transport system permease protein
MGYLVARFNVDMVSATLTNLYLLSEIESLQVPASLYALAVGIGLGGALAGAFLPAIDMSRKSSKSLLTGLALREEASSLAWPLFGGGWLLLSVTALWYGFLGQSWKPSGFVLAIAVLLALPLLTPYLVQQIGGKLPTRGFGFGYSLKSLTTRLQATSFAVASLAIAVSMLLGITLMIGSFRRTVEVWVETTVQADIYLTTPSWRSEPDATVDAELVAALVNHPGVVAFDRLRRLLVTIEDKRISMAGVDMGLSSGQARFPLLEGDRLEVLRQVQEGGVLIGEPLSRKSQLHVGDLLQVRGGQGVLEFPIAGVYYDYTSEMGSVAMDLALMEDSFGPGSINSLSLYLEQDLDPERVIDEIKARFPNTPLQIRSNQHLREEIFRIFDQTFAVVRILQLMSLLIAVCGIMLTLLVLARERISEWALYQALGASRLQIFRIFVGKGLAMGLIALGLGSVAGSALAAILIFVINRTYFGWTIQVYFPGWPVLQQAATILAAALLASLYPAFRASETPATELSRDDLQ